MQAKGLIKVFLVLLILVSLLQIFYLFPTRKAEKDAVSYAEQFVDSNPDLDRYDAYKQARIDYLDSISSEDILSIPLLGSFTYEDLKSRQLALGLDLKGGMSSVLQVDLKELLIRLSRNSKDPAFRTALDNAEKAQLNSQSDFVSLFAQEYAKIPERKSLASIFMRDASMKDVINIQSGDGEVARILRQKASETVNLTFNRLKQRIDKLGVTQPNVSLDGERDLILVEMPGIENFERARNFLQASAALEFWDTYRNTDPGVGNAFSQADQRLKNLEQGNDALEEAPIEFDTIWSPEIDSIGNLTGDSTFQVIEKTPDLLANQGPLLRLFQLNTGAGELAWGPTVMGFTDKNKRKAVMELLNKDEVKSLFPINSKFMWSRKPYSDFETGEESDKYMLYLIKTPNDADS
ncbi:MAG: protein translocase subunit SecDF, partial [Saprospiraceae bacterium]|nr:protein translocase subunit SecDF [Saprospiraceae bacterium]